MFCGGTVSFDGAKFTGGTVRFDEAVFSGGTVSFYRATFSGGLVRFIHARFSGGKVSFTGAMFSDGSVDLQSVVSWAKPPHFDTEVLDNPPQGSVFPLQLSFDPEVRRGCCWTAADGIDADPDEFHRVRHECCASAPSC